VKSALLLLSTVVALLVPGLAPASELDSAHRALDRLTGAVQAASPFTCGTVDILEVEAAWSELGEAEQRRFHDALGVPTDSRNDERGGVPCFYELSNIVESDHFTVQWGEWGGTTENAANYLLDGLERARETYLGGGYSEPMGNPDIKVPFYLGNSGAGAPGIDFNGGYTTVCTSYQHAYVVMSGINADSGTVDVGVHELFHAVQMGSPDPYGVDGFYWEASAVWAEDFAEPDLNIYAWFLPYYTGYTHLALDYEAGSEVGFMHQYAMFIFPTYIDEYAPGGDQVLVDVWTGGGEGLKTRMEASWAAQEIETSFAREFGGFTAYSSVMAYDDQLTYNSNRIQPRATFDGGGEIEGEEAPDHYGSHYYRVDPDSEDVDSGDTKIRVALDGQGPAWVLALNRSSDGNTALPTVLVADSDGVAEIEAIDVGTLYEEAWVAVSCARQSCDDYDLTIEMIEQTEEPGSDIDPGDDDDDDGRGPRGVDCSGTGDHPFAWKAAGAGLGLLFAPLLLRRRR